MSFKPIDSKRDEFRKYLEKKGVIDELTKVMTKLLNIPAQDRPENAIEFIFENMGHRLLQKDQYEYLKKELEDSRNEIAELKREIALFQNQKNINHLNNNNHSIIPIKTLDEVEAEIKQEQNIEEILKIKREIKIEPLEEESSDKNSENLEISFESQNSEEINEKSSEPIVEITVKNQQNQQKDQIKATQENGSTEIISSTDKNQVEKEKSIEVNSNSNVEIQKNDVNTPTSNSNEEKPKSVEVENDNTKNNNQVSENQSNNDSKSTSDPAAAAAKEETSPQVQTVSASSEVITESVTNKETTNNEKISQSSTDSTNKTTEEKVVEDNKDNKA